MLYNRQRQICIPKTPYKVKTALVLSHRRALHELLHSSSHRLCMILVLYVLLVRQQQPVQVEP